MVIDCHVHYEPEMFPLNRMIEGMEKNGIDKAALIATMVEPFYLCGKAKKASGDFLRYTLFHWKPLGHFAYETTVDKKGNFVLVGKKYHIYERPDNKTVAEAIEKHPDRFMGWIFVNPAVDDDPIAEIEKWSSNPGMVGIKTHPFWHRYPVNLLDPVADWCRENDYPLLMHLGSRHGSGDYKRLPERFPGLKVLYAHAGIPYYQELWAYIKDKKDVYIDLSSPYLDQNLVRKAVEFLGAEKCLYGTDGPYGGQRPGEDYDYGWIRNRVDNLTLSGGERERVFSENFEEIRAK